MSRGARLCLLAGLSLAAGLAVLALPPIPQDPAYHQFADRRACLALPHCLNVVSNAAFLLVGALGLGCVFRSGPPRGAGAFGDGSERWAYGVLFAGVALTALGSGYYHTAPDNSRLVWDRLPMTLGFMALVAATVAERISPRAGRRALWPLVAAGAGSVFYWQVTEWRGAGDLRPYLVVQFGPLLILPLIALLFPPRYTRSADLYAAMGLYLLAKAFEALDAPIFALGRIVSGHTLKHLAAALAVYWILRMLRRRAPLPTPGRLLKKAHDPLSTDRTWAPAGTPGGAERRGTHRRWV